MTGDLCKIYSPVIAGEWMNRGFPVGHDRDDRLLKQGKESLGE